MMTTSILFPKMNISISSVQVRAGGFSNGLLLECIKWILPNKNLCLLHVISNAQQVIR